MKVVIKIAIGILVFIGLFIIISFFLPRRVHIERTTMIQDSNTQKAYDLVIDMKKWDKWSPWHNLDSKTKYVFSEPARGKDAWYTWESSNDDVGRGKLSVPDCKENEYIKTTMDFDDQGKAEAEFFFTQANPNAINVKWTFDSDMGYNPIGRFMGLFMDKMLGPDYEKGLASLKSAVEKK